MSKVFNRSIQVGGEQITIGAYSFIAYEFDRSTLYDKVEATTANIPQGVAGFSVGCALTDSTTGFQYTNTGTSTSCTFVEVARQNPVVGQAKVVTLTAAQLIAMYTTPVMVVPAIAGKEIYIDSVEFDITRTATSFTGGGVVNVQYDSTANGAGTTVHADIAATIVTGAAGTTHTYRIPKDLSDIADSAIAGKALYISNKTAAFAAGTGTAQVTVHYHVN